MPAAATPNSISKHRATRKPRIGCMGELLVEFVCLSRNGHNHVAATYSGPYPSGAPGIFIDQAARAGADCVFVGAVGDDAFGDVIEDRLARDGVECRLIARITGVPTGSAFVSYNDNGTRDFVFNIAHSAAARIGANAETLARLEAFGLDVMHVSGSALGDPRTAAAILHVCKSLHGKGVRISFDPNIRKELVGDANYFATVSDLLNIAWIVLPSEEDADVLFRGEALEQFATRLFQKEAVYVILKKGEHGASGVSRAGEREDLAAHPITVADPTGAGDCFCGTFVTLIASGMSFSAALERANAAGALAVTKLGPMEGASTIGEIEAFLNGGRER
jgi:sugar/nucleoside kinase (ribokinase family)